MSSSYLNKEGLARLWYQISDQFVKKEAGKGLFSGNYADLTGAPTNVSAFNNDAGYAVATEVAETYLSKTDAATTYVTLAAYNEKVAALEKADTDNLAEANISIDSLSDYGVMLSETGKDFKFMLVTINRTSTADYEGDFPDQAYVNIFCSFIG